MDPVGAHNDLKFAVSIQIRDLYVVHCRRARQGVFRGLAVVPPDDAPFPVQQVRGPVIAAGRDLYPPVPINVSRINRANRLSCPEGPDRVPRRCIHAHTVALTKHQLAPAIAVDVHEIHRAGIHIRNNLRDGNLG